MTQENKSHAPRPKYKTYGEIVWEQFTKYRLSYLSLWGVLGLFTLAIITPLFALNVPFFMSVPTGTGPEMAQGLSFPWLRSLFDVGFFESGVDIFFNSLIFTVPLLLLGWQGLKRSGGVAQMPRQDYVGVRTKYLLGASAFALFVFISLYFYGYRQPYIDYVAICEMDNVSCMFPIFETGYRDIDLKAVTQEPSWAHWLGTDDRGRDVMVRMLYGTRISLTIGILAVGIYTTIGMILGGVGGFFGGRTDMVVMRLIEVMICFPSFFLILTLRGFVEQASVFHIMLIIGLTGWTGIARLVRGEFLRLRNQDFVQAAIALGLPRGRIIFRHLMPNALGPVLVSATFGVAGAIILEASLSFLGLGPTTAPSWGQIMTIGRQTHLWALILAPGFAIFVTVSLLNLVGEGIRDAIDPKMRK